MENAQNTTPGKKSITEIVKDSFKELGETFVAFINAPKALWGINLPYILEGLVYFGILTILGKYCSENVGLADSQASLVYSFVTGGITFAMLLLGGVSDKIGVRNSLIVSFAMFVLGRFLIALSGTLALPGGLWSPMFFMLTFGLLIMVIAYGFYQPAAYAGVKKYTTPKTAAMGYAVIYGFMNLGAFLSGFVSSLTRPNFEDTFPPNGLTSVFWVYVFITAIALAFTIFLLTKKSDRDAIEKVKAAAAKDEKGQNDEKEEAKPKEKINNLTLMILGVVTVVLFIFSSFPREGNIDLFFILSIVTFIATIVEYLRRRADHPFRDGRFSFFIFILIPVQTLFAHNWLTLPYYLDRAFKGSVVSEYFEVFSNINPILIFILAPLVAGLTARANIYKMMIYGTIVMGVPTFLLTLGPNLYLFLIYVLIMTIGEAMWQPRFLQWIAEVAPEGKTGMYMGVGQFPWFLTKVVTGFYSGWFLEQYCPLGVDPAQMNTETMWLIYGIIAMMSSVGLILAKSWMVKGFKEKHGE